VQNALLVRLSSSISQEYCHRNWRNILLQISTVPFLHGTGSSFTAHEFPFIKISVCNMIQAIKGSTPIPKDWARLDNTHVKIRLLSSTGGLRNIPQMVNRTIM
jgi:hypothetical protein